MRKLHLAGAVGLLALVGLLAHCGNSSSSDASGDGGGGTPGTSVPSDASITDSPVTSGSGSLPCAVSTVLGDHCQSCHQSPPLAGAPMPLMTWADFQAPAKSDPSKKVYELVAARIADDAKPMPPPPNARLSGSDTTTLTSWIAAGAPSSTDSCVTKQPDAGVDPLSCNADLHFQGASPWNMPQADADDYVCYGVDVTSADPKHIIAFAPRVDNHQIVHHMLVFQSDTSVSSTPAPCSPGGSVNWKIVYAWAPGGQNLYLPSQAGFPIGGGTTTHYVVQVHYNNINALAGQTDTSGIDACTGAPRQYEADVVAFGTTSFTVPPHSTYDRYCKVTVPSALAGKTIFTALPHMHQIGSQISTSLTPAAGGANVDLGNVSDWNFQSQYWLPITAQTQVNDTITTHCQWKNTTGSPVSFGQNTEDEMCYSFTMYYPRITSAFSWAVPAASSTCSSTP